MLAKNESQMDRAIRLVIGLVLLAVGYSVGGWLQIVLYILAIYALITAAAGTCWIYNMLGMNTAKTGEAKPVETKTEEPHTMPAVEPEAPEEMPEETASTEPEAEMPAEEETPEVAEEPTEEPKEENK
jgi:cytoskeletal protein RodZ